MGNHIRAVKSFFDKCYVFSLRPNVLSEMKGLDFLNLPNIYSLYKEFHLLLWRMMVILWIILMRIKMLF